MQSFNVHEAIRAVEGKVISSAAVINDFPDAQGVLLVFTDGSELNINFHFHTRVAVEVQHYRWVDGEVTTLDRTTGLELRPDFDVFATPKDLVD